MKNLLNWIADHKAELVITAVATALYFAGYSRGYKKGQINGLQVDVNLVTADGIKKLETLA